LRSRNGNRPFLLTGIALIFSLSWGSEHYYIGYRLATKDIKPFSETFSVSKAMVPCSLHTTGSINLLRHPDEPLVNVLEREKNIFLEYAANTSAYIQSNTALHNAHTQTQEIFTLPTQCYAVEFNDDSVTISLTKE